MNLTNRKKLHREVANVIRERKRLRRERAEIQSSYAKAQILARQSQKAQARPAVTYRSTDAKDPDGEWPIVNDDGAVVTTAPSRTRARELAREMNQRERSTPPLKTVEDVMRDLGYEHAGDEGTIEQRWRRRVE